MLPPDSSAGGSKAREEVRHKYRSLLGKLVTNSKRHIDALTALAKESKQFTKDIVFLTEAQITQVPPSRKLPIMYVMDSIVKNVGGKYLPAFASNLPRIFPCVFEEVDADTKKSLFQLRCTWNGIFPAKKLLVLDIQVNVLDPAWPIQALPPNLDFSSILTKRKFPNKSGHESTTEPDRKVGTTENTGSQSASSSYKRSPCSEGRISLKRRCDSSPPSSSPPKTRKVALVPAQPGPQDQPQDRFPHPASCAHSPAADLGIPPCRS